MSDATNEVLSQAYELIEENQVVEARELLEPLTKSNPDDADVWWLYAHAVTDINTAERALNNVLRINPAYPGARDLMSKLKGQGFEISDTRPRPAGLQRLGSTPSIENVEVDDILSNLDDDDDFDDDDFALFEESTEKPKTPRRTSLLLRLVALVAVVLFFIILFLLLRGGGDDNVVPTATVVADAPTLPIATFDSQAVGGTATDLASTEDPIFLEATEIIQTVTAVAAAQQATAIISSATTEEAVEETATESASLETETDDPAISEATEIIQTVTAEAAAQEATAAQQATEIISTATAAEEARETAAAAVIEPTVDEAELQALTEAPLLTLTAESGNNTATAIAVVPTNTEVISTEVPTVLPTNTPRQSVSIVTPVPNSGNVPTAIPTLTLQEVLSAEFTLANAPAEFRDTEIGRTYIISVCSQPGEPLRNTLNGVMTTLANAHSLVSDEAVAIGVSLRNCENGTVLNVIAVSLTDAVAFAEGTISQSTFRGRWRAIG